MYILTHERDPRSEVAFILLKPKSVDLAMPIYMFSVKLCSLSDRIESVAFLYITRILKGEMAKA